MSPELAKNPLRIQSPPGPGPTPPRGPRLTMAGDADELPKAEASSTSPFPGKTKLNLRRDPARPSTFTCLRLLLTKPSENPDVAPNQCSACWAESPVPAPPPPPTPPPPKTPPAPPPPPPSPPSPPSPPRAFISKLLDADAGGERIVGSIPPSPTSAPSFPRSFSMMLVTSAWSVSAATMDSQS